MFCDAISKVAKAYKNRSQSVESNIAINEAIAEAMPNVVSGSRALEAGLNTIGAALTMNTIEELEGGTINITEFKSVKGNKFNLIISRPNVYIGLYYPDVVDEYSLISMAIVLVFEIKHKLWKRVVYYTNHRNPEKDLFT